MDISKIELTHTLCKIIKKEKKWCRVHDPNSNWNTNIAFYKGRTVWGGEINTVWVQTDYLLEQTREQQQSYKKHKNKATVSSESESENKVIKAVKNLMSNEGDNPGEHSEKQKAFKAKQAYWCMKLEELDKQNKPE